MDMIYVDPISQKEYPQWMVQAVDNMLYKVANKDIWEIVEFAMDFWKRKHPVEYQLFLKEAQQFRQTRGNKYSSTKDKHLRQLITVPNDVMYILEKIAGHRIEEYGKLKFYREFARRYSVLSPAESI